MAFEPMTDEREVTLRYLIKRGHVSFAYETLMSILARFDADRERIHKAEQEIQLLRIARHDSLPRSVTTKIDALAQECQDLKHKVEDLSVQVEPYVISDADASQDYGRSA